MRLSVIYQNGSSRVVNLHNTFFSGNDVSWEERATSFAHDTGKPYRVSIHRDGEELMSKRIMYNSPVFERTTVKVDERSAKKQLRRQFKHASFTMNAKYQF